MKKKILIACVALLAVGCKHDTFTISGTIENGAGKTLWLEEIAPEGPLFIDSIPVDSKGHFKYTYKMPYRSLYNLHTTENNYIVTLPDYGEKLEVSGDWNNLSMTYDVSSIQTTEARCSTSWWTRRNTTLCCASADLQTTTL